MKQGEDEGQQRLRVQLSQRLHASGPDHFLGVKKTVWTTKTSTDGVGSE